MELITRKKITREKNILTLDKDIYDLDRYKRVFVLGIGKCALKACLVLEDVLEDVLYGGMVYATDEEKECSYKILECLQGSHPLPTDTNIEASHKIADFVDALEENDLLITVISGGASTLLCLPHNATTCVEEKTIVETLMRSGATITEMNTVRKHLSALRGGNIAARAFPATVLGLVYSDVPGDDTSVIASGPTVLDTTTLDDARRVLEKYSLEGGSIATLLKETPKNEQLFTHTHNIVVLSNTDALKAAKYEARRRGYNTHIITTTLQGEAREVGKEIVETLATYEGKTCLLFGGETTVTLSEDRGEGGRNQELALSALGHIGTHDIILSLASDGRDNSDVAGALVDAVVRAAAENQNVSYTEYLDEHNSYEFFSGVGGHLVTGPTGSNVSDIIIALTH